MVLLKNCRLIPALTEGYEGTKADVLLEGEKIADILPPGSFAGEAQQVIDAGGKTLMPGLIDLHCHLYMYTFDFNEVKGYDAGTTFVNTLAYAQEYLRQGYTTVRDCGTMHNSTVAVHDAICRGLVNGPRIISTGQILTPTETGNASFGELYYCADGPYEVRKGCRRQFELGNDAIKYMVTGAFLNEKGDPGLQIVTMDELKAAVEVAELKGSYVVGHAHSAQGVKTAIAAGVRSIEHGVFIDDEGIALLKDNPDCFLVPTGAITMHCHPEGNPLVTGDAIDKTLRYEKMEVDNMNKAYAAGLKLGFGSDIDYLSFKGKPGYEFIARTELYTFKPLDILLQATKNSAEIARLDHLIGTVKKGKLADLIVVDGNPEEDIYVMTKQPLHIFSGGKKVG